ncbi:MAG TPA: energy-coupling factor transporter transmembrane component T [Gemmataceae bacterium]|nr:energy-coupling factor transporter transmembrane component T [Gemmataceae bacterium]
MTLAVAFPVRLGAPLSRVDPRWKLAALVPVAAVAGMLQTLGAASAALIGAFVLAALARLPLRWYLDRIATLAAALALFLALLPFLDHGDEGRWTVGFLSLSPKGLTLAAVLLLKALTVTTVLLAAATTAPMQVHLKALHALGVPGLVVQLSALTLRYLAVVHAEFSRIRIALRVRGYRQRFTPASLRTVGHVTGMLLVRASDQSERVAQALRCRGFDGRFHALTQFQTSVWDVAFFLMVAGTATGLLYWDLLQR